MPPKEVPPHCIIGAGFSGLTVGRKLTELSEGFEILDANPGPGGLWHTGAYDSAHLISSKRDTQFEDFAMPESYPDFPGKEQMRRYLQEFADHFGLTPRIRAATWVHRVRPAEDFDTTCQWIVEAQGQPVRRYATVTIANGHLSGMSVPKAPHYPGDFSGEIRYASQYRNAAEFAGRRVLVVGAGNTGCDIAVDSSRVAAATAISMRGGRYFIPKTFLGIPLTDLGAESWLGRWFDRLTLRAICWLSFGSLSRYGLPDPDHRILDKHLTMSSQLLYQLKHGRIAVRPEIRCYDGNLVEFVDGTREAFDVIVFAVGYEVSFPMLLPEDDLLDWEGALPVLSWGMMAPRWRGLFFSGLGQAQAGGGPLFQGGGDILGRLLAKEVRSAQGVMAELRANRALAFADRHLGSPLVAPLDEASHPGRKVRQAIVQALSYLDAIGCPDAPRLPGRP